MGLNELQIAEAKVLAEKLHALECKWNHTDGCSWYYAEKRDATGTIHHDWSEYGHRVYLKKAMAQLTEQIWNNNQS